MRRSRIDLSPAGPDWNDWTFGPYGNCRSFRLVTPTGEALTASEILATRHQRLNLTWAMSRIRQLERELKTARAWIDPKNAERIRDAFELIDAALPARNVSTTRRDAKV